MIGFRYHVVSLTAVFLALAIGVIAGTTVLPRPLLNELRNERNRITANNAVLRDRTAGLDRQLAMWDRYGKDTFAPQTLGRLRGVNVVRIVTGGPPKALLRDVDATLRAAGATSGGTLVLSERFGLPDERARTALGTALAVPERDAPDLWQAAGDRLATRLGAAADPRSETDLLRLLDDDGFLELQDAPAGRFPQARSVFLVIAGGAEDAGAPVDPFLLAFGRGMANTRAAVAEPMLAVRPGVEMLRAVVEIRDGVGTVDHLDSALGRFALIEVLAREAAGGAPLHFGVGERATALAPALTRPATPAVTPRPTASPS